MTRLLLRVPLISGTRSVSLQGRSRTLAAGHQLPVSGYPELSRNRSMLTNRFGRFRKPKRKHKKMLPYPTESLTLKIWDRSAMDGTLESAAQELAARSMTPSDRVLVTRIGPGTYTLTVEGAGSYTDPLQEVPC